MSYDPNTITPIGKTYAEIDAEEARYVAAANDALASWRDSGVRWWRYTVSHRTFELVVGDALARGGNLVICMSACDQISGPVAWSRPQLRVEWENKRATDNGWLFTVRDDRAGFIAVGRTFSWTRDIDLCARNDAYAGEAQAESGRSPAG